MAISPCSTLVDVNNRLRVCALESDVVDGGEEREVSFLTGLVDACHHVPGGAGALQLLAIKPLGFDHVPRLWRSGGDILHKYVCALSAGGEGRGGGREVVREGRER